jgi:methylated-DNA-[protein]-cysteine S-methyltransferase
MRWTLVPSPVDDLLIAADGDGLCVVGFHGRPGATGPGDPGSGDAPRDLPPDRRVDADADPTLRAAADQLDAYFEGRLTEFTVPLSVRRGSEFERAVWAELARIPYAQTRTYGQVAASAVAALDRPGDPGFGAARAVGVACNRNPLAIVLPCHRVVGAGRKLVGFGGGLDRKRFLLELEAKVDLQQALS